MYKAAVQIKNIKLKNCLKLPLLGPDIKKMTIWFKSFQFILFKFQIHTQPAFTCSKLTTETLEHVIAGLVNVRRLPVLKPLQKVHKRFRSFF